MKKILIAFCLVLSSNCLHATEKEIIKSTLTDVTVYAQGAQLHHKANYSVKIGVTEIIIEGISSFIDPKSQLRVFYFLPNEIEIRQFQPMNPYHSEDQDRLLLHFLHRQLRPLFPSF